MVYALFIIQLIKRDEQFIKNANSNSTWWWFYYTHKLDFPIYSPNNYGAWSIPGNIPVDVTAGEIDDVDADGNHGSAEQFQSFMAVESLNVSVAAGVLLHHLVGHQVSNNSHIEDSSTATVD